MMNLIAGIVHLDGSCPDQAMVHEMLSAMAPTTCPTRRHVQRLGSAVFGHLTASPDAAALPSAGLISTEDTLIASDARIFDVRATTETDVQTCILRTAQAGRPFTDTLHGEFAIAAWTASKGTLTLCRDHIATRPLNYTSPNGRYVAFASTPTALLATGLAPRTLDAASIAQLTYLADTVGERTPFAEIRSVQQAETVTIGPDGQIRQARTWRLPLGPLLDARQDPAEIAAELRRLFDVAVQRRVPAVGNISGHVSGGLDSTSISIAAARHIDARGGKFFGFSYQEEQIPGLSVFDEREYAQAAYEFEPLLRVTPVLRTRNTDILDKLDPDTGIRISPDWMEEQVLSQAAARRAVTHFSGWCGDEVATFTGVGGLVELLDARQYAALWQQIGLRARNQRRHWLKILFNRVIKRKLRSALLGRAADETFVDVLTDHGFSRLPEPDLSAHGRLMCEDSQKVRRSALEHWYIPKVMDTYAYSGARYGISYTFPMADLDLMEFAVRIPVALFGTPRRNRAVFRQAMTGILPEAVLERPDKSYPFPAESLRIARSQDRIVKELGAMRSEPTVADHIDLDRLIGFVKRCENEHDALDALNRASAENRNWVGDHMQVVCPVYAARFLHAQTEQARAAACPPRAVTS